MHTSVLTDEQYRSLSKKLIKSVQGRFKIVALNSLKHPKYVLERPIFITIEADKDAVIATLDDIEAFAYADTEFEAVNNLCNEIVSIFEELREDRHSLGPLPKRWLDYLKDTIKSR